MRVDLFSAGFSAVLGTVVVISLLVGKTPYIGFFGRYFVAWRRRDPGPYWSMIAQYSLFCILGAAMALLG